MEMDTEELKKITKKSRPIGIIFLFFLAGLVIGMIYYPLLSLLWTLLAVVLLIISRKSGEDIEKIGAILAARRAVQRISKEELSAPISLSDLKKRALYYKIVWKFGPEKGALIYLGLLLPIIIISILGSWRLVYSIWPDSTPSSTGETCFLRFFIVWMVVLSYFIIKKQAGKLRYYMRKEFERMDEGSGSEKAGRT